MHSDADILEAIRQDPIADAERVMGKTVDESKVVQGMALDLQFRKAAALKHMLEETHDTHYSINANKAMSLFLQNGFERVFSLDFDSDGHSERFDMMYRDPGLLLIYETYRQHINTAKLYYAWKPSELNNAHEFTHSGGFRFEDPADLAEYNRLMESQHVLDWDDSEAKRLAMLRDQLNNKYWSERRFVWVGDYNGREGLFLHIRRLEANGKLVAPWPDVPWLWALHHMDTKTKDYDYRAINLERLGQLPDFVKKAINFERYCARA